MSGLYERLRKTADRLLNGKGQSVTISRADLFTYDKTTGKALNLSSEQYGTGAVFEYSTQQAGIFNAPGSLVKAGDKQLLLSALNSEGAELTAPSANDIVTIGQTVYTITQVKTIAPDGTAVLYDCNIRGSA